MLAPKHFTEACLVCAEAEDPRSRHLLFTSHWLSLPSSLLLLAVIWEWKPVNIQPWTQQLHHILTSPVLLAPGEELGLGLYSLPSLPLQARKSVRTWNRCLCVEGSRFLFCRLRLLNISEVGSLCFRVCGAGEDG